MVSTVARSLELSITGQNVRQHIAMGPFSSQSLSSILQTLRLHRPMLPTSTRVLVLHPDCMSRIARSDHC